MKVLMIEHFSQANSYTIDLCKELSKYVKLTLLTVDKSPINRTNYTVKKILCGFGGGRSLRKVLNYIRGLLYTIFEIVFHRYDCVHVQTFRNMSIEIYLYKMLKPFIKKFVHTAHNIMPHELRSNDLKLNNELYNLCDCIIVHNESSKEVLIKNFDINKNIIHVMPHGSYEFKEKDIDVDIIKNSYSDKVKILFFGLIRSYKGVDLLIEAISKLPENYKNKVDVTIAGNNIEKKDYTSLINGEGLSNVISLVDKFIPDEEVDNYFNWADVVVLPYREIYGSGALLLSYTFDKPVIISNLPSFIEETDEGRTGLIFQNEDSNDLANKIVEFICMDNKDIYAFVEHIRYLKEQKYNWGISAEKAYKAYIGDKSEINV